MRKEQYKAKSGAMQWRPVMTEKSFSRLMFDEHATGFCLACGEDFTGVEPDARKYTCESCGAPKVYGLEELMVMGLVKLS